MSKKNSPSNNGDAWYVQEGPFDDVVLSTKVTLCRNLANFPFPKKMTIADAERVEAIIFDAFNHLDPQDNYQVVSVSKLDDLGVRILKERDMLETNKVSASGVAMRMDGKISCTVNIEDHLHIYSFETGFNADCAIDLCRDLDKKLQKKIQFAASYDFGYLTSSLLDAGSGMKILYFLHLPSLSALGRISDISKAAGERGLVFSATYGSASSSENVFNQQGVSLGAFYKIESKNSFTGSEYDQLVQLASFCRTLIDKEISARDECKARYISTIQNEVYRAYALTKFSKFITYREGLVFLSYIKWGLNLGLIGECQNHLLYALLFRIQNAHLEYVLNSTDFNFEKDIADNTERKVCRLRAFIIQEAFETLTLS